MMTIARGPKPTAALKELGITADASRREPNTWREVLADDRPARAGGQADRRPAGIWPAQCQPGRRAGSSRGDTSSRQGLSLGFARRYGPLEDNVRAIADGLIDVALFTSSHQVTNLLRDGRAVGPRAIRCAAGWPRR